MMGWKKVFKFMSVEKARKYLDKVVPIALSLKNIRKLQFIKDDQRSQVTCLNARNEVRNKETQTQNHPIPQPNKSKSKNYRSKKPTKS